jgi:hypothetical protein
MKTFKTLNKGQPSRTTLQTTPQVRIKSKSTRPSGHNSHNSAITETSSNRTENRLIQAKKMLSLICLVRL